MLSCLVVQSYPAIIPGFVFGLHEGLYEIVLNPTHYVLTVKSRLWKTTSSPVLHENNLYVTEHFKIVAITFA
jgi:hypothetical protein